MALQGTALYDMVVWLLEHNHIKKGDCIMTQEEKAKAYDKILVKAMELKEAYPSDEGIQRLLDDILPKLAESEDERIRKALHIYLDWLDGRKDYAPRGEYSIRDMIAWLEKQKLVEWSEEDEMIRKEIFNVIKSLPLSHERTGMLCWLEKQGEKPQGKSALEAINEEKVDNANKVEPKFHEGDWISGYYTNYKVMAINSKGYAVEDTDGNKINILFENEKFHHLWTIQDAKDGDVLVSYNKTCPFIYRTTTVFGSPVAYCGVRSDGLFISESPEDHQWCLKSEVIPATKEQRDLLFQKMKKEGYEWDAEKKELKKIEQKPAWSDEDEHWRQKAIGFMKHPDLIKATPTLAKSTIYWLKSLKDRVQPQPQQEWSEEDEKCLATIIAEFSKCAGKSVSKDEWLRCNDWLNSLKPQNTWKPSDAQLDALKEACDKRWEPDGLDPLYTLYQYLKKLK